MKLAGLITINVHCQSSSNLIITVKPCQKLPQIFLCSCHSSQDFLLSGAIHKSSRILPAEHCCHQIVVSRPHLRLICSSNSFSKKWNWSFLQLDTQHTPLCDHGQQPVPEHMHPSPGSMLEHKKVA